MRSSLLILVASVVACQGIAGDGDGCADECPGGSVCIEAACRALCSADRDCEARMQCDSRGYCVAATDACGGCPDRFTCFEGACAEECLGSCADPVEVCSLGLCLASGGACGAGSCDPGALCLGGACVDVCGADDDCAAGAVCFAGACVSAGGPCGALTCDATAVCIDGACEAVCDNDDDCVEVASCLAHRCEPRGGAATPIIASVVGDGSTGQRVRRRVTILGDNLSGAAAELVDAGGDSQPLEVCFSANRQLVVSLPDGVAAGSYTLRVLGQGGSCSAPLQVLQGERGPSGPPGPSGPSGTPCVGCVDLGSLADEVYAGDGSAATLARSDHSHANGVLYERWGRTICPAGATLVYAGIMTGKHYTHGGGGTNPTCLNLTPEWLDYNDGDQNGNLLYGAEYETGVYGINSLWNWSALQDQQVPCAVCYVADRGVRLLHPGRLDCPPGWTREYRGYLMGLHYQQGASDSFCVDDNPEASPYGGGAGDDNGYLIYFTEGECGALPCSPDGYVQDREITCAVCTL